MSDDSVRVIGYYTASAVFGEGEPNETTLDDGGQFIARYSSDGSLAWARSVPGFSINSITSFPDDTFAAVGTFKNSAKLGEGEPNETTLVSAGGFDIFVALFQSDCQLEWAKSAGGIEDDRGSVVTGLSDNSIIAAGEFESTATFGKGEPNETQLVSTSYEDCFIARYLP
jgi:hypothetical protein